MHKKLSAILSALFFLSLSILAGCSGRTFGNEDQQFQSYTKELFCQEVSTNSITLHYTLNTPETYGIKDVPITFGTCTTDIASLSAATENAQAVLHSYKRKKLSEENRLTYDLLDHYFNGAKNEAAYTLYAEPLAPLTGTQSQLPVLLSEYQLLDTDDVETYLALLTKIPAYFDSIIEFEKTKSQTGLFMASYTADSIIEECSAFTAMGDVNYLFSSFQERLTELKLPEADYKRYIEKNAEHIKTYVFPSYKKLTDMLFALRTSGVNNNGLCHFPKGKDYYELLVKRDTGSSRSISELQQLTNAQIKDDLVSMQHILTSVSAEDIMPSTPVLADTDPASILTELKAKLKKSFPTPPSVDTKIKYVQKSMQDYLSPAFYMVPAIDSTTENVIYINQGHLLDDLSLYTTLAHEGYPGHLYQTVYYQSKNPDPIRSLLNCAGYTEGWATYSEMMSYYYAPLSKEQATLLQKNTSVILGMYALADMGIHYEGWKLTDAVSFFHQYGITDAKTIENIYDLIIADPANYLKYYIGYVEFLELKKDAMKAWGNAFTQKKFHKAVLDAGPVPFAILRDYIL